MKNHRYHRHNRDSQTKGFTFIELIVTMAIFGIMIMFAIPSFVEWKKDQNYKHTATQIKLMLREARNKAITSNIQHEVVVDPGTNSFKIVRGSQAYNTPEAGYSQTLQNITSESGVTIRSGPVGGSTDKIYVQFNPDGTALLANPKDGTVNDGNVTVNNGGNPIYLITVRPTGRITLSKPAAS